MELPSPCESADLSEDEENRRVIWLDLSVHHHPAQLFGGL